MFFIAYAFKGQVHVFAGQVNIVMSLVMQDKCNIEIFSSLAMLTKGQRNAVTQCSTSDQGIAGLSRT